MAKRVMWERLSRLERGSRPVGHDPWAAARCFREMGEEERSQVLKTWLRLTRRGLLSSPLSSNDVGDLLGPDGAIVAARGEWEAYGRLLNADGGE